MSNQKKNYNMLYERLIQADMSTVFALHWHASRLIGAPITLSAACTGSRGPWVPHNQVHPRA